MKITSFFKTAIGLSVIIFSHFAAAVDADSLAKHLDIRSWETHVELPPESFRTSIVRIKDGKPSDRLLDGPSDYAKTSDTLINILIGSTPSGYKITVIYDSNATLGTTTNIKAFNSTSGIRLPQKLSQGDYLLFGKLKSGLKNARAEEISSYEDGFLFRVQRDAQQDAAANP
jgi:hypothetical protein